MINFIVEDITRGQVPMEIPEGISMNLMELLKAAGYDIPATCGGMALCATCLVEIFSASHKIPLPGNAELDMLDTLPSVNEQSRLSCQIRINDAIKGCIIKIPDER